MELDPELSSSKDSSTLGVTRVTKSSMRGCRPRQGRGLRLERELVVAERREDEGKQRWIYT